MLIDVLRGLQRRWPVEIVNERTGNARVTTRHRVVGLHFGPREVADFAAALDEPGPRFQTLSEDEVLAARVRRVVILIEECLESDLDGSLVMIELRRDASGEPRLHETFE